MIWLLLLPLFLCLIVYLSFKPMKEPTIEDIQEEIARLKGEK